MPRFRDSPNQYDEPADIVFQSLAKVQYQTTRTEIFFFLTDPLLSDHYLEATEKGWTGYLKSIPLNKFDLIKNVRFDRLHV